MQFLLDVRYAFRSLRRLKTFSAAVIITIALAIAVDTAAFAILNGSLFQERIYKDSDRLIQIRDVGGEINYSTSAY